MEESTYLVQRPQMNKVPSLVLSSYLGAAKDGLDGYKSWTGTMVGWGE